MDFKHFKCWTFQNVDCYENSYKEGIIDMIRDGAVH